MYILHTSKSLDYHLMSSFVVQVVLMFLNLRYKNMNI